MLFTEQAANASSILMDANRNDALIKEYDA